MAASSVTYRRGKQQFQGLFSEMWTAQGTINFAEVADGDEAVDTIAVPGVALGDMVLAVSASIDVADLGLTAQVTAANEVTVQVWNNTGGAINLAEAVYRVVVARPNFS
jgi:N-acetyl-beta-hexosaminidase